MSAELIKNFSFDGHALISLVNRKLNSLNLRKFPEQSSFDNDVSIEQIDPDFGYVFGNEFLQNLRQLAKTLHIEGEISFDSKFLELDISTKEGAQRLERMTGEISRTQKIAETIFDMVNHAVREKRALNWSSEKDNWKIDAIALKMHEREGRFYVFSNGKVTDSEQDHRLLMREMIIHPRVLFPAGRDSTISYVTTNSLLEVQNIVSKMYEVMIPKEDREGFNVSRSEFKAVQQKRGKKRVTFANSEILVQSN